MLYLMCPCLIGTFLHVFLTSINSSGSGGMITISIRIKAFTSKKVFSHLPPQKPFMQTPSLIFEVAYWNSSAQQNTVCVVYLAVILIWQFANFYWFANFKSRCFNSHA